MTSPQPRTGAFAAASVLATCLAAAVLLVACGNGRDRGPDVGGSPDEPVDWRLGGMTTVSDDSSRAFAFSARNFNHTQHQAFARGTEFFEAEVDADGPEAVGAPPIDALSCADCHVNHGRAAAPTADGPVPLGSVVRLADPVWPYGSQLQRRAAEGGVPDAEVIVSYDEETGRYADGTGYRLRRPTYTATGLAGVPLPATTTLEVRLAPPLIGLGLLELIPVEDLGARADPDDADGDGISGELATAYASGSDPSGSVRDGPVDDRPVGRFGWTASQPSVDAQVARALAEDLAVSTSLAADAPSVDCDTVEICVHGDAALLQLGDDVFADLVLYSRGLAVPARRNLDDPDALAGELIFHDIGCSSCHVESWSTGPADDLPQGLGGQDIHPYTDLLLHDLGPGLADRRLDGSPANQEWRTAPLWGIGLTELVGGGEGYLHDGRARSVEEAILWHDGEAGPARDRFTELDADQRAQLLAFLASL